jgi:hypothetical protein
LNAEEGDRRQNIEFRIEKIGVRGRKPNGLADTIKIISLRLRDSAVNNKEFKSWLYKHTSNGY